MRGLVVVAAGLGRRLSDDSRPKALVRIGDRTLLGHVLARAASVVDELVVVHTPGHAEAFAAVIRDAGVAAQLVAGGATRTASVRAGVAAIGPAVDRIGVHDAARALTPTDVIERTFAAVAGDVVAAAPGLPVADTLKAVEDAATTGGAVTVVGTRARQGLWGVHTPQVVVAGILRSVLADGQSDATDDLGLVERAIAAGTVDGRLALVPGHPLDLKITYPYDLELARALVRTAVVRD